MDIQYFKSAWGDIKNSRGWFGKLCLLGLLNFIPIFGQIVSFAYIYGWAREIAWGTHEPMPSRIFNNDDGKFWRRGWFIFVLVFVFSLIPGILYSIGATLESTQVVMTFFGPRVTIDPVLNTVGALLRIVGFAGIVLAGILAWVGSIRVAIYDRLSAGFQLGKIWKMIRHDSNGIVRIFGMQLLFGFLLGLVLSIVLVILLMFVVMAGVAGLVNAGYTLDSLQYMTQAQAAQVLLRFFASAGGVGIVSLLIGLFMASVVELFVQLLVVRAVGYWTMQFEVPIWGGQDDPMPFELVNEPEPTSDAFAGAMMSQPQVQPQRQTTPGGSSAPSVSPAPGFSYQPQQVPSPAPQDGRGSFVSDAEPGPNPEPNYGAVAASQPAVNSPTQPAVPVVPLAPIPMPPIADARAEGDGLEAPGSLAVGGDEGSAEGSVKLVGEDGGSADFGEPVASVASVEPAASAEEVASVGEIAPAEDGESVEPAAPAAVEQVSDYKPTVTYEAPAMFGADSVSYPAESGDERR